MKSPTAREVRFFGEFAPSSGQKVGAGLGKTFRDRPRAVVLLGPERAARMGEQDFQCAFAPERQKTGTDVSPAAHRAHLPYKLRLSTAGLAKGVVCLHDFVTIAPTMPASSPALLNALWKGTPNHFLHGSQRQCDIDLSPLLPFVALAASLAPIAKADDNPKDVKGLYLMSDYPAVTLRPGETSSISLRLQNYDLPPERLALSVSGVSAGWTATLMGGGQPVAAAMPATNASVALELRLDVPKNAPQSAPRR